MHGAWFSSEVYWPSANSNFQRELRFRLTPGDNTINSLLNYVSITFESRLNHVLITFEWSLNNAWISFESSFNHAWITMKIDSNLLFEQLYNTFSKLWSKVPRTPTTLTFLGPRCFASRGQKTICSSKAKLVSSR